MFGKLKLASAAKRLEEEKLYEAVVQELEKGLRRDGLWAKALANSNGNEEKVKALYIQYRIQSIKDEGVVLKEVLAEATRQAKAAAAARQSRVAAAAEAAETSASARRERRARAGVLKRNDVAYVEPPKSNAIICSRCDSENDLEQELCCDCGFPLTLES